MKFSLIISSYNPDFKLLQKAVSSAVQLFDEIIIVNDGSDKFPDIRTDGSEHIIYIRHETNKGISESKNDSIRAATGDVIAILDDDDFFDRDGVNRLMDHIKTSQADIWHFNLRTFGLQDGIYGTLETPHDLELRNSIPGVSWFKKSVWEAIGGFTYPLAEDWDFWLRAREKGFKFEYVPVTVYNFNLREGSTSSSWKGEKFLEIRREILQRNGKTPR